VCSSDLGMRLHSGKDPLQVLCATMPATIVIVLLLSTLLEHDAYSAKMPDVIACLFVCALALSIIVMLTMQQICGDNCPVLYACIAPTKTAIVVTLAWSWGESMNTIGIIGAAVFSVASTTSKRSMYQSGAEHVGEEWVDNANLPVRSGDSQLTSLNISECNQPAPT
jgi:hypothetical protein